MYCLLLLLVLLSVPIALAFSLSLHTPSSSSCNTVLHAAADRRAFVQGVAAVAFFSAVTPAFAEDVDDLAMPSEDEEAKAKATMEEKLRKKAELQKKATRPATFGESFKGEMEKQKEMQMTKEERRNRMCEELGRGC